MFDPRFGCGFGQPCGFGFGPGFGPGFGFRSPGVVGLDFLALIAFFALV